ncbi:unnamed protein product [Caenorhabditis brenneri]
MRSRPIVATPVEEALQDMGRKTMNATDPKKSLEKQFLKHAKKGTVNNSEFENIELKKYYELTLEMSPELVGLRWIQNFAYPFMNNRYINSLCKTRICPESYAQKGSFKTDRGPMETSLGQVEETHIKCWIQRLHTKFVYNRKVTGTKRIDFDRVVRDYYETAEILKRTIEETGNPYRYKILDALYHKANAIDIFLMTEICEAQVNRNLTHGSRQVRQDLYNYVTFLINALFMYEITRDLVYQHRESGRNTFLAMTDGKYGDNQIFGYLLEDGISYTGRPILITSGTPSCSHQDHDDIREYYS